MDYAEEGRITMQEMTTHLHLNNDLLDSLKSLGTLYQDLDQLQTSRQQQLEDYIQKYTRLHEEQEIVETSDKSLEKIEAEQKANEQVLADLQEQNEKVSDENLALSKAIEESEAEEKKIVQLNKRIANESIDQQAHIRLKVGLYQNLSGIQWDYDCDPNEVKGFVSTKHDVRPFCLNKQQNSSFFITNYLWDLMEAAHQTPSETQ